MGKAGRTGSAKGSRNKTRSWRKGRKLDDLGQSLDKERSDERPGGRLGDQTDGDLFTIDTKKVKGPPAVTRRQRIALAKKTAAATPSVAEIDVKPKVRKSYPSQKKSKVEMKTLKPVKSSKEGDIDAKPVDFDLWSTDFTPKAALPDDLADYYLRQLKKKMPNEPRTVKHITTVLSKVEVPVPGASYNPSYEDHQDMLRETLNDEMKVQKDIERVEKRLKLAPGDRYITPYEKMAEEMSGLVKEEKTETVEEETNETDSDADKTDTYRPETAPISSENRKLSAARRRDLLQKKKQQAKKAEKQTKKLLSDVFRAKTLQRQVEKEQKRVETLAKKRAERKKIDKFTKPNRISKAKFEAQEEPVILTEDLVGSLRELKPAGDLMMDRFKSFQKRNMLTVPGEKHKRKLKRKLKVKYTEKRSVQEVTVGSRVL